jgi:CheY-like chemotaxis protein
MGVYSQTILVVDDDPNDCILIERSFRAIGVNQPICLVEGGDEAIRYLKGEGKYSNRDVFHYPTFIITDLKMGAGDGFSVLEHLKNNPEWAVIPTIVLSASEDPDDIRRSYLLGASCYHVKPVALSELRRQLKILHEYWTTCRVPKVDGTGRQMKTDAQGKLGARFGSA